MSSQIYIFILHLHSILKWQWDILDSCTGQTQNTFALMYNNHAGMFMCAERLFLLLAASKWYILTYVSQVSDNIIVSSNDFFSKDCNT